MIKVDITGQDVVLRKLKKMSEEIAGAHLEKAVLDGAEVIRQEASARAPKRPGSGFLAANIAKEVVEKSKTSIVAKIGPTREAFYGLFLEMGTVKMRPRPFLRPAIDEKEEAAKAEIIKSLKARLGL